MSRYIGETARSISERNREHQNVLKVFNIRKLKSATSALSRQIMEAVEIAEDSSHCFLNNKEEYNRCIL